MPACYGKSREMPRGIFQRWLALRDRFLVLVLRGAGGSGAAGFGRRLMSFGPRSKDSRKDSGAEEPRAGGHS